MKELVTTLDGLDAALGDAVAAAFNEGTLEGFDDERLMKVIATAARIGRRAEALLIESAAHVEQRATVPVSDERITNRFGCRSASELMQRATRSSSRSIADVMVAARAIQRRIAPSSGEMLPPDYPALRAELAAGRVGIDGIVAVVRPLRDAVIVAGVSAQLAADAELAACIRGEGADAGPPPCADDLRALATVWATYLDQDGAEPREAVAMRKRGVVLGICRDGQVPLRGTLLPEVAAQLQLVFDSILNPKNDDRDTAPAGPWFEDSTASGEASDDARAETRSRAQRQHDAFASALMKLAGSGALPSLGGAAPTLVVSVRAEDLTVGRGFAHIDGVAEQISLSVARHIGCSGNIQRVISDANGRIVGIETSDRVFTHFQRKAIALRDGGCLIPGCHVPASWCELHHVTAHAAGGPTHTDNGVMLCWHHHRTLDDGVWKIRMNRGIPEIRGPNWWDPSGRWRATTSSPTRMRERVARRT